MDTNLTHGIGPTYRAPCIGKRDVASMTSKIWDEALEDGSRSCAVLSRTWRIVPYLLQDEGYLHLCLKEKGTNTY